LKSSRYSTGGFRAGWASMVRASQPSRSTAGLAIATVIAVGYVAGISPAQAQSLGLDVSGGVIAAALIPTTAGFSFSVSAPIQITDLAVFDAGSDGFTISHDVGLWTSGGTLLRPRRWRPVRVPLRSLRRKEPSASGVLLPLRPYRWDQGTILSAPRSIPLTTGP